jgi:predicted deacylase
MKRAFIKELKLDNFESFVFGKGELICAITAGIHGDEQTSVYAAELIMDYLENAKLLGSVIVLPLCNPTAFRARSRETPVDNADLNRSFKEDGSGFSINLANKIWNVVADARFLLDLHCCGQSGSLYVMSMHDSFAAQKDAARALGIKNVVHSSEADGQLFVRFNRQGKQALLIEMPGGQPYGIIDEREAARVLEAAIRFLNYCQAIQSNIVPPEEIIFHGKMRRVAAPNNGLFVPAQKAGERLRKGGVIGNFNDEEILMPFDGTLLAVNKTGYVFEGERLYTAAPFQDKRMSHGT